MFIRFDVIHERDRRTDGRTDRHRAEMKAGVRKNGDFYRAMLCMRYMPSCDVRPSSFFTDIKHFAKDRMSATLFPVRRSTVE